MSKENKVLVFPTLMKNSSLIVTDPYGGTIEALEKAGYEVKKYSLDDISQHAIFTQARNIKRKPKYLIIPIKKKWFDMILSGEKKEEYREMKPYWEKRFKKHFNWNIGEAEIFEWHFSNKPKKIKFQNGYGKDVPSFMAECTIRIGTGKEEWGAEAGMEYYILEIQKIL